jgi:hypothetical protein
VELADTSNCRKVVGPVSTDPGITLGGSASLTETAFNTFGGPRLQAQYNSILAEGEEETSSEETEKVKSAAMELILEENSVPVALEGKVPVKINPSAEIVAGDLLYPGDNGVATTDSKGGACPSIGVAMQNYPDASIVDEKIMVLVK